MYVTFIGNPTDPSDNVGVVRFSGMEFPLNREVEVAETPLTRKLRGNRHFKVRDAEIAVEKVEEPAANPVEPVAELDEKAELVAFAKEHNIKIDKRWSVEKINLAIEAAVEQRALQAADTPED